MKIYDAVRVREIDNYTIMKEPVESIDLMERAATRLAGWYVRHFNTSRRVVIFAGPGNNAQYTIVKWVGVRLMEVKLNGNKNSKRVLVQEAPVEIRGVVPGTSPYYSSSVFSPAFLLQ